MRLFKRFLQVAALAPMTTLTGRYTPSQEWFDTITDDTRIFVLAGKTSAVIDTEGMPEETLALPFRRVWIEATTDMFARVQMMESDKEYRIAGMLVEELGPNVFRYYIMMGFFEPDRTGYGIVIRDETAKNNHEGTLGAIRHVVLEFLRRLSGSSIGVVNANEKIKLKGEAKPIKSFHKLRKIIYVVPKSERGKPIEGEHRKIDWTHRWTVRGHWRRIAGLGKDRDGEYTVSGYTWVADHVKGPDHAPLVVDKIRVITKGTT